MSESSKLPEYLEFRETTKTLLHCMSLWPSKRFTLSQRFLPFFSIIICAITSSAIFGFVIHHRTRVAIVVRGMSIGTSFLTSIIKSKDYLEAVYSTNWLGNRKVMHSVLMTLNQRPLTMKAWHMSIVSVDMFVMVLNTTMSYFLLLQTIEQT